MELMYDRINEYSAVTIKLASPEEIRSWSYGEVKKPETINYRTYRPEKDGLFCERIFGPEKDWECFCGKYKGIKYKGIVCDRCGVEITQARVRRKRMGHINLAAPCAHIWFFKTIPSRIGSLLAMKTSQLERVIYYQDYIVTEVRSKRCPLKEKQLLTEEQYREARERYREDFEADMGAAAVRTLLQKVDLKALSESLRAELGKTASAQKIKDIVKRLKTVEMLIESGNKPEWMIMTVIPVIPPDLRPLVLLDSGNFATSDLNDLYRRLINRNNRLKKLLELNAPEVIIRNEKRMLQQSLDALFDNTRCRRPVLGSNNRPLKSLSDIIKGKQGRFRENLLGKRVDYSARSVIVVGPELKLHQCGLPKKIALELYQPFIIRRLKELGKADTIKSAKKMLERRDESVWDILEEVIKDHPVLLNRAPTLHRMGIQAFQPVLVEGNAIELHPLVCTGFNADFDGDQMAVHLPLSYEAQIEAHTLMMSTQNVFSPAHGNPVISPTQDMVLGIYYLTLARQDLPGGGKVYASPHEAILAYDMGKTHIHAVVQVRYPGTKIFLQSKNSQEQLTNARVKTTVGRLLFNEILPPEMPFFNYELDKKGIQDVINRCHRLCGKEATLRLLDALKELGFKYATRAGISFSKDDMTIPPDKEKIIRETQERVDRIERNYQRGALTPGERYNQIIDEWTHCRERVTEAMMAELRVDQRDGKPFLNPIRLMVDSGARGSQDQVRQLAGMRGLMAKPSGKIIETPILSNFREGLTVLEYFSSTHGARKGLADTALKTADAGYLTRKLVDVAQSVVVTTEDCGTLNGITKGVIYKGEKVEVSLAQSIYGRIARDTITDIVTDEILVRENDIITEEVARKIENIGFTKIRVRSPLTCEASNGICARCYGMDLSLGTLVEEGTAVGIIAAQSIGEPGTQLTMRTFHIGGVAVKTAEESKIFSKSKGVVKLVNVKVVPTRDEQLIVVNRNGELVLVDEKDREIEKYILPSGSYLRVREGAKVKPRELLAQWDPHNVPIIAGKDGVVRYEDIKKGETMQEERDPRSGVLRRVIMEHKGELHPQLVISDEKGVVLEVHPLPEKAHIEVEEGQKVKAGVILAKNPREIGGTQDITGGLPRVTELFEARKPKEPAVIAEIDGIVELGEKKRGRRTILVKNEETGIEKPHVVPLGRHIRVHTGDRVRAGDPLIEGPLVPHDILRIRGEEEAQQYILREVQSVYRAQNVTINDKHVELIIAQMMRKVRIQNPGDTPFLPNAVVDKFRVRDENNKARKAGKKPATFKPLLLGVTKAAIQSESFIAAASFQETTKVLTDAALAGRRDELVGLKENVIVGHMVPAGTGFKKYLNMKLHREEPQVEPPAQEELVPA
ncbi:MAG TPA: DNA-directed RNA polymerase subunit beta' [Planctomycetota bacterium]|jgi:DNA-directed RNA polymerase subunit beta'|nr:DNA-directed RNA polymerase subunit beta' [Planctomycetota bacterium]